MKSLEGRVGEKNHWRGGGGFDVSTCELRNLSFQLEAVKKLFDVKLEQVERG